MEWGRKPRRLGAWYVTEHMVRAMRAYGWTIIVDALGQPIIYLLGLAVGLATLDRRADRTDARRRGVATSCSSRPRCSMTRAIAVASEEFTLPGDGGFKWRRYFYGVQRVADRAGARSRRRHVRRIRAHGRAAVALLRCSSTSSARSRDPAPAGSRSSSALLAGLAFGVPLMAYAASIEDDKGQFALVQRFIFMPMFLFSGTFYPLDSLPLWLQWIGWISPLWHATELGRIATRTAAEEPLWLMVVALRYLIALHRRWATCSPAAFFDEEAREMTAATRPPAMPSSGAAACARCGRATRARSCSAASSRRARPAGSSCSRASSSRSSTSRRWASASAS